MLVSSSFMFYLFERSCADCQQIIEKSVSAARNFTQSDSENFSCPAVDPETEKTICLCAPCSGPGKFRFLLFLFRLRILMLHSIVYDIAAN